MRFIDSIESCSFDQFKRYFESMDSFAFTSHQRLDQLARHCPQAISAYLQCIVRANEKGEAIFSREQITDEMCESFIKFRNNLRKLALEGVLEFHHMGDSIHVILALEDHVELD